jgi:hypothetical protein
MPVLKNPKHERFSQLRAEGVCIRTAYVNAGFKDNPGNAGRLNNKEHIVKRIAEIQKPADEVRADVREMARTRTKEAVDLLTEAMNSAKAPWSARVMAAQALLDRGWGKAPQTIEVELTPYDTLTLDKRLALVAAIDALDDDAGGTGSDAPGVEPTKH